MIYIEKIKFKDATYPGAHIFKKDLEIKCASINLLVGDQGCGKSTLLKLLRDNHSDIELSLTPDTLTKGVDSFYFDSESDNPRVKDAMLYSKPDGTNIGIGMAGAVSSKFKSHGEVLQTFIIKPLLKAKKCVVLLDEPESGLSLTNQFKLIDAIKQAVDNKCQLFIATHCYPLIEHFDVFSLEHNEQMSGIEFIKLIQAKK